MEQKANTTFTKFCLLILLDYVINNKKMCFIYCGLLHDDPTDQWLEHVFIHTTVKIKAVYE